MRVKASSRVRTESAETYTDWASRLRADYSARRKSARRTSASGSSSSAWPTAVVGDSRATANATAGRSDPNSQHHSGQTLTDAIRAWPTPTPTTRDAKGANSVEHIQKGVGRAHLDQLPNFVAHLWASPSAADSVGTTGGGQVKSLRTDASNWSTPTAHDGRRPGADLRSTQGGNLSRDAALWATPCSRDHFPPHTPEYVASKKAQGHGMKILPDQVQQWVTPTSAIAQGGQSSRSGDRKDELLLTGQAREVSCSRLPPTTSTAGPDSSPSGLSLNPQFVEALMGWAPGSTSFACSATAWSRWLLAMRSALSQLALPDVEAPVQPSLFG